MKIIISRKGFDWANGGTPSPVLPDGTMVSMPIPSCDDTRYDELTIGEKSYAQIWRELKPRQSDFDSYCHLDPDIRRDIHIVRDNWVPAFGQVDAAESHLENQGVTIGDLFLFFGWFRQTEEKNGVLRYKSHAKDAHMLYGYLQIGTIARGADTLCYPWHPHAWSGGNNTIYEASDKLIIDGTDTGLPGAGVFRFSPDIVLTKDGESRSRWELPEFFKEVSISHHTKESFQNGYFQTVRIGQEFVVSEDIRVTNWAKDIIIRNYDVRLRDDDLSLASTYSVPYFLQ